MVVKNWTPLLAVATVSLTAGTGPADPVFISEYGEGASNNKYLEIYNGTGGEIDMADYRLWVINNGTSQPGRLWSEAASIELSGSVGAGDVYVICNSRADAAIKVHADAESGSVNHNGNDAVGLARTNTVGGGWTLIDAIGREGDNPGNNRGWTVSGVADGTLDHVLVRSEGVEGTTNWLATGSTQWALNAADDFANLGYHATPPEQPPYMWKNPPATNLVALYASTVQFELRAGDYNGDLIALGSTNLPAGAALTSNPAMGMGTVANVFTWTPTAVGEFPVDFTASDDDGTRTLSVTITVPASSGTGLLISELCDPENDYADNRYIEIYNPTIGPVALAGWKVVSIENGSADDEWVLSGTLASGAALVCGDTNNTLADVQIDWGNSTWNGGDTDGAALYEGTTLRDYAVGQSFADAAMTRKPDVTGPSIVFVAEEWTVADCTDIGLAPATPGTHTNIYPTALLNRPTVLIVE